MPACRSEKNATGTELDQARESIIARMPARSRIPRSRRNDLIGTSGARQRTPRDHPPLLGRDLDPDAAGRSPEDREHQIAAVGTVRNSVGDTDAFAGIAHCVERAFVELGRVEQPSEMAEFMRHDPSV